MTQSIVRGVFIASLVVALVGGVGLIGLQTVGLAAGSQALVVGPNGTFKTMLCIAGSISAIAAYLLTQTGWESEAPGDLGANR